MNLANCWPRLLQWILATIIVVQLLRAGLLLYQPLQSQELPPAPTSTTPGNLVDLDPFFSGTASTVPPEATDWRLAGLRTSPDGGSAILAHASGPQRSVGVGQAAAPGVILRSVAPDHVVLNSGGRDIRLEIPDSNSGNAPKPTAVVRAPAPPASAISAKDVDPVQLLTQAGLRPSIEAGRIAGYTLLPRGDDRLIRSAGLQAGDVVTGINGESLSPERLPEVIARLKSGSSSQATVTYRRNGRTHTVTIGNGS